MDAKIESKPRRLIAGRFSGKNHTPPIDLLPSQVTLVAEVKAKLLNKEYRMEPTDCPCGQKKDLIIAEIDRYGLPLTSVLCLNCGTVRFDPFLDEPSLSDFYVGFYQEMYARARDVDVYFSQQQGYGQRFLDLSVDFLKLEGLVCEVGCGAGGALKLFQDKGFRVTGCDYSERLIEAGRLKGVQNIYHGSFADLCDRLKGEKIGLLYAHHVFEHLSYPLRFLHDCKRVLAEGGRIILAFPDVSRIDRCKFPAGDLLPFLHIAHKYNYSSEGVRRLARSVGLSVVRLTPNPMIQTAWSAMPELWIQLSPSVDEAHLGASRHDPEADYGRRMLSYLIKTERMRRFGFCRAQYWPKFVKYRSRVMHRLRKIKHSLHRAVWSIR